MVKQLPYHVFQCHCKCQSNNHEEYHCLPPQTARALPNTTGITTTAAPTQERQKSPASGTRNKAKGKKGKGGKVKPEPPEETDPRKLELIRWVRTKSF